MRTNFLWVTLGFFTFLLLSPFGSAQANSTPDPHSVPVIDGGIGPCTADFTINDNAAKPVYDARIKVHISYGTFGAHKLDLEVGTNIDGRGRFTGLPEKTKQGLFFEASKDNRAGSAFDDTSRTCSAQFTVQLEEKKSLDETH